MRNRRTSCFFIPLAGFILLLPAPRVIAQTVARLATGGPLDTAALICTVGPKISAKVLKEFDPSITTMEFLVNGDPVLQAQWGSLTISIRESRLWKRENEIPGMKNWIGRLPSGGENLAATVELVERLNDVKACIGLEIRPGFDDEGRARKLILALAERGHGFVFSRNGFYDLSGRKILGDLHAPQQLGGRFEESPPRPAQSLSLPVPSVPPEEAATLERLREEGIARRARTLQRLREEGISLTPIGSPWADSAAIRKLYGEDIARRAVGLYVTAAKGAGLNQKDAEALIGRFKTKEFLSPEEARFVAEPNPDQRQALAFEWCYESLWVLLWSLGYVDDLPSPASKCDVAAIDKVFREVNPADFVKYSHPRSLPEVLDKAELHWGYQLAVAEAVTKGLPVPASLDPMVVHQRQRAFAWLVTRQQWDTANRILWDQQSP